MLSLTLNVVLPGPEAAVVENLTVARQSAISYFHDKKNRRLASYRALPLTLSLYRPIVAFHCLTHSPARLNGSSLRIRQLKKIFLYVIIIIDFARQSTCLNTISTVMIRGKKQKKKCNIGSLLRKRSWSIESVTLF